MAISKIEWTEVTWNPTTGCDKISAGCLNCYAETMARRLQAMGNPKYRNGFRLTLHPDCLSLPYSWTKPRNVFVNSMSDLFHTDIPLAFVEQVFRVMNDTSQHTYQVLTKRSERLKEIASFLTWTDNIWLGVTVENQDTSERIFDLVETPAKIKFISFEPLIGFIPKPYLDGISWVIVGGESGPNARPIKKEWVDTIHRETKRLDIPFFFKQWGKPKFNENPDDPTVEKSHPFHAKGGCLLDGRVYRELPVFP